MVQFLITVTVNKMLKNWFFLELVIVGRHSIPEAASLSYRQFKFETS